jgi:hypothetical protein
MATGLKKIGFGISRIFATILSSSWTFAQKHLKKSFLTFF